MNLNTRLEIKDLTASGSFAGYGNVYNVVDEGGDIVAPGCFSDSLSEWRAKGMQPAMLWQHRPGEPIGAYQVVREDKTGLYVEGSLALKTVRGSEAYELLKMDAISGLSIGYETDEASIDQKTGIRTITKADLWEVSLVTFPMNDQSRVSSVKGLETAIAAIETERDMEDFLRKSGIPRAAAVALVAKCKVLVQRESDGAKANARLLTALRRGAQQ